MYSISRQVFGMSLPARCKFRPRCIKVALLSSSSPSSSNSNNFPRGENNGNGKSKRSGATVSFSGCCSSHFLRIPMMSNQVRNNCQVRQYSRPAEQVVDKKSNDSANIQEPEVQSDASKAADTVSDEDYDEIEYDISLTDEEIQMLTQGDPDLIKKIKFIQLEHSVLMQEGEKVPSKIGLKHWKELLPLDSRSKRRKYFNYLFKTEMRQLADKKRKEAKKEQRMQLFRENPLPSREEDEYGMFYCLTRNTLFLRLYDTKVNQYFNNNVATAMKLHPPLVIDCSYGEHMSIREQKNCAKQLELLIVENRTHREPFNLHLCNIDRSTPMVDFIKRFVPILEDDTFALNFCEEDFMDLFPPERLVYLTPHCRDDLEDYNEDDIYIIGAMVDKTSPLPYSYAKAKKLNIRMRRLPLDKYLMWGLGGKSLTLNQVVKILLDVRFSRGNWKESLLKNVPWRKLCRDFHPYPDQEESGNRASLPPVMSQRRERKSFVIEDYELMNRRKGFRRSDMFTPKPREGVRAPKIKSILHDDEE